MCSIALERIPSDIRKSKCVARMSDLKLIKKIQDSVLLPVMVKVRIGYSTEASIVEAIDIDN
ncbi:hypothetical protein IGK38_002965 [Enterococcus pernyi]